MESISNDQLHCEGGQSDDQTDGEEYEEPEEQGEHHHIWCKRGGTEE